MEITSNVHKQSLTFRITDYLRLCGYISLDLPTIELAELFLLKGGDRVFQHLFTFEDGSHTYALRPEFTAQALNLYVNEADQSKVVRWQFAGNVFRRDTRHFARQQYEIGVELIGARGSHIDAEILGTAISAIKQAGLKNIKLVMGNIALLRHVIRTRISDSRVEQFILSNIPALNHPEHGVDYLLGLYDRVSLTSTRESESQSDGVLLDISPQTLPVRQMLLANVTHTGTRSQAEIANRIQHKMQRSAKRSELRDVLIDLQALCSLSGPPSTILPEIRSTFPMMANGAFEEVMLEWEATVAHLAGFDFPVEQVVVISPGLVRAWDYYTGVVFDVYDADSNTHLGGGGRYDDLAQVMGADTDVPAIGFVINLNGLATIVPNRTKMHDICVSLHYAPRAAVSAFKWSTMLRDNGFAVLLTDLQVNDTGDICLTILDNGNLIVNGVDEKNQYALDQFDSLVALLKKVNYSA